MARTGGPDQLRSELRDAWLHYVDLTEPHRGDLYAYCRRLTRTVWDAEDLVQETLLRAFGHLGHLGQDVPHLRAYLLRAASNVWIDQQRRLALEQRLSAEQAAMPQPFSGTDERAQVRDAGERLLHLLAPQERAAIVLKDVFELSLAEIAEILVTTPGSIKAALHRGRGRLGDPDAEPRKELPAEAVVDRFVELYQAQDVAGLVDLLAPGGSAENVGFGLQFGRDAFEGTENFLYKVVHGHEEWPAWFQPEAIRMQRAEFEGARLLLWFATRKGDEALELVLRVDPVDGRIARLRSYAFCPETMREVAGALGVPVRTGLYRLPDFDV